MGGGLFWAFGVLFQALQEAYRTLLIFKIVIESVWDDLLLFDPAVRSFSPLGNVTSMELGRPADCFS